jgi:CMP-N-acetylneuraminic acid synthetase
MDRLVDKGPLAVIPARSGSKRLPGKNLIDFLGKPLVAWSIEAAVESGLFGRVIVSTDSSEVAAIATQYGAEVPFMRESYADDHSPVSMATIHAILQLQEVCHEEYASVVQLMPNCPLRRADHIVAAFERFRRAQGAFLLSCVRLGWMNPWWSATINADSAPEWLFPDALNRRSQDLPPLYCPSGAIWIAETASLLRSGTFHARPMVFHPMDWKSAIDIDDAEDLELAKAIFRMQND